MNGISLNAIEIADILKKPYLSLEDLCWVLSTKPGIPLSKATIYGRRCRKKGDPTYDIPSIKRGKFIYYKTKNVIAYMEGEPLE